MKLVWHNYPIHLQIFHIVSAHWLYILQMAYNLRNGRSLGDEEQPPPPPPPPTLVELMQTVIESQRMLAETMRQLVNRDDRNVRQGPEPNQYNSFKDFMDTKPSIFREAEEPLQADEWLSTIEQRFQLLRLTEGMKASYAGNQLQGPTGIWWNHHKTTFPANIEVVWDQFKEAFRGHFIPPGLMKIKHTEFMKLTQGNRSLTEYLQAFNKLARYAPEFVDTNAKKIMSFKRGLSPKLMRSMGNSKCVTFNDFISDTLTQENNDKVYAASKTRKRNFEAGASQAKAPVISKTQYRSPTANIRYRPP
jgi:hypothetical protein